MGDVDDAHCAGGGGGAPVSSSMVILDVDEQTAFKAHVNNFFSKVELGIAGIPLSKRQRKMKKEKDGERAGTGFENGADSLIDILNDRCSPACGSN